MGCFIINISFSMLAKELLKSMNLWQSYRHCSPYTFVLKDAELAR